MPLEAYRELFGEEGIILKRPIYYEFETSVASLQIKEAIDICHSMGHKVTANVIFGLPALGEEASLKEFIHTMQMLEDYKADFYSISILYRDPKTLQGLVHERLSEDTTNA